MAFFRGEQFSDACEREHDDYQPCSVRGCAEHAGDSAFCPEHMQQSRSERLNAYYRGGDR